MSEGIRQVLEEDDQSLKIFLRAMGKFDKLFCDMMAGGLDFTLRMELKGNAGEMVHCRVSHDEFERPTAGRGVERRRNLGRSRKPVFNGGRV